MLYALDIETKCDVPGCPQPCNLHGLIPASSKITCVGAHGRDAHGDVVEIVFRDLTQLKKWIEKEDDNEFTGHNFKFDLLHLAFHGVHIPLNRWVHDSKIMARISRMKVPLNFIEGYEKARLSRADGHLHRKAEETSLKLLAPYFLGAQAFWENPLDHDDDEYVLTDCRHTFNLTKLLLGHVVEQGLFNNYVVAFKSEKAKLALDIHDQTHV